MNDEAKIKERVLRVLKEYGIIATNSSITVTELGPDNVSLHIVCNEQIYYLVADDVLDDEIYSKEAHKYGLNNLEAVKLLKSNLDGEYITMFDGFMLCKLYRALA